MGRGIRWVALIGWLVLACARASAIGVQIVSPANGSTVSGVVTITGTATDLQSGRVTVSIDGGAFVQAVGGVNWSHVWDTTGAAPGTHTITARARRFPTDPGATQTIVVQVAAPTQLGVAIASPTAGQTIFATHVMTGTSSNATMVEVSLDGAPFVAASGLGSWWYVIEPGRLADGARTLTARATGADGAQVTSSVTVNVSTEVVGQQDYSHTSSVDGSLLEGVMYVPASYGGGEESVALVCYLHGGGGLGVVPNGWASQLESRNVILIAPDGRRWGLSDPAQCPTNPNASWICEWCTSAAYVNNWFDARVGPGEQDVLDTIDWAMANFNIDPDRVYLTGFSMGGRGTYQIGLRNPDRFAAIAPLGPASDMYEVWGRLFEEPSCREGMTSDGAGGMNPGDSAVTDTLTTITSARFLIENAYNLPVFHCHGALDTLAFNLQGSTGQYLHGEHMLFNTGWSGCHPGTTLCFGHTPTLSELRVRHPDGYDWGHLFTQVAHTNDPAWAGPVFDFLLARRRVISPDTVVYKTYTAEQAGAYWCGVTPQSPWSDVAGMVRARRNVALNRVDAEVSRVGELTVDASAAGLTISPNAAMRVGLAPLAEPAYDPAIGGDAPVVAVVVRGEFASFRRVEVLVGGVAAGNAEVSRDFVRVAGVVVGAGTEVEVRVRECAASPECAGDADGNGAADGDDVIAFFADWDAGRGCADATGDGAVDGDDVIEFFGSWDAGC